MKDCEPNKDVVEEPVLRLARTTLAVIHPTKINVADALSSLHDSERSFLLAFCCQYYRRVLKPRNQADAVRRVFEKYHTWGSTESEFARKLSEEIVAAVNATE